MKIIINKFISSMEYIIKDDRGSYQKISLTDDFAEFCYELNIKYIIDNFDKIYPINKIGTTQSYLHYYDPKPNNFFINLYGDDNKMYFILKYGDKDELG